MDDSRMLMTYLFVVIISFIVMTIWLKRRGRKKKQ